MNKNELQQRLYVMRVKY